MELPFNIPTIEEDKDCGYSIDDHEVYADKPDATEYVALFKKFITAAKKAEAAAANGGMGDIDRPPDDDEYLPPEEFYV